MPTTPPPIPPSGATPADDMFGSLDASLSSVSEASLQASLIDIQRRAPAPRDPRNDESYDKLIRRLLNFHPTSTADLALKLDEIYFVVDFVRDELMRTNAALVEMKPPVMICGDTHVASNELFHCHQFTIIIDQFPGQYSDLIRLLDYCGWPPDRRYLFLGDYVDRGPFSIETVCLVFLLRLRYPNDFFILRGNHETSMINRVYGFYEENKRRYGSSTGMRLWARFQLAFDCLPIAALVDRRIFCMHGGLSPELQSFDQIRTLVLPFMIPNQCCLVTDLLWSDPFPGIYGYIKSNRGVSYLFGEDVVHKFCKDHGVDLVVRAHQVVQQGYEFFADRKLVTVFSAPNYCGEFNNSAGMIFIAENLKCSILELRPDKRRPSIV
uniref:Serine/threonine-protein phosphatase n=1 Tax=Romanomermis culicivorax TaxID=13658 RepID=A0A915IT06_ROMCU